MRLLPLRIMIDIDFNYPLSSFIYNMLESSIHYAHKN